MQKIIFFNIGWMKYYRGITEKDSLDKGGEFTSENGYGYEIFNFFPCDGRMYGYVQPSGRGDYNSRSINIDNLGAPKQNEVGNVVSVWLASHPEKGGTWVVGWYENSTVYRTYQQAPANCARSFRDPELRFGYWVTAKEEDCVCLPVDERTLQAPRGKDGIGQSNVWYAQSQEKITVQFCEKVEQLVSRYRASEVVQLVNIRQQYDQDFSDANDLEDARKRVLTSIVRRQGQSRFRQKLLTAYKGRCAISGCDVEQALEAAHIIPYNGIQTNNTSNGLLLRADLHTLFDLKLITIDPIRMKVLVSPELMKTQGRAFWQKGLTLPTDIVDRPDTDALRSHYNSCTWTK
jgi:HNH endonuclease